MKKLHLHKMYTPRDIAKILWGKEILEIQRLLKGIEKDVSTIHNGHAQKEKVLEENL